MPSGDLIQLIKGCIQGCYACDHTYAFPTLLLFNTILCFKILPMCVGPIFSLDKSDDNFISCYVCDPKFVNHVVYFVH